MIGIVHYLEIWFVAKKTALKVYWLLENIFIINTFLITLFKDSIALVV